MTCFLAVFSVQFQNVCILVSGCSVRDFSAISPRLLRDFCATSPGLFCCIVYLCIVCVVVLIVFHHIVFCDSFFVFSRMILSCLLAACVLPQSCQFFWCTCTGRICTMSLASPYHSDGFQCSPEKFVADTAWKELVPMYANGHSPEPDAVSFIVPPDLPTGPVNQMQRVGWADQLWDRLCAEQRDQLIFNMSHAQFLDHFSGMGSRTQICKQIAVTICRHTSIDLSPSSIRAFASSEIASVKRRFTNGFFPEYQCVHECGDVMDHLPTHLSSGIQERLKDASKRGGTLQARRHHNACIEQDLLQCYSCPTSADRRRLLHAPCLRHPHRSACPMTPLVAESDTDVEASDQVLVVSTAGPSCVDNSAMNNVQPGDSGRSYVATQQFLHERSISCDDIVYLECTPRWSVALVADALKPQGYIVHKFYLQGHQNGDRYSRKRCGALALRGTMTLKMPLERYLEQTGSLCLMISAQVTFSWRHLLSNAKSLRSGRCCAA